MLFVQGVRRLVFTVFMWCTLCAFIHSLCKFLTNFRIKKFSMQLKHQICNKVVSGFHSIVMFSLTFFYWFWINPNFQFHSTTFIEAVSQDFMLGYLIYDTVFEVTTTKEYDAIGHHLLGFWSIGCTRVLANASASYYAMLVFIAEISTPFLNMSWILHQLNRKKTMLFKFCFILLIISFFLFRIVLCPYMIWHLWSYKDAWMEPNDFLFYNHFIITILFSVLNYFWFYKLIMMALRSKDEKV
jgi:hypothetical protein